MKRLYISIAIFILIIALGVLSIVLISNANAKLYGEIENVISGYKSGADLAPRIKALREQFVGYSRLVGSLTSDEKLQQIEEALSRLIAMYESDSDEFLAECYLIKTVAQEILQEQLPTLERLL